MTVEEQAVSIVQAIYGCTLKDDYDAAFAVIVQIVRDKEQAEILGTRLAAALKTAEDALREIYLHGTSRPTAFGAGDDGDGWWKTIAEDCIGIAARASDSTKAALAAARAQGIKP